jgi:hypothetical protein
MDLSGLGRQSRGGSQQCRLDLDDCLEIVTAATAKKDSVKVWGGIIGGRRGRGGGERKRTEEQSGEQSGENGFFLLPTNIVDHQEQME